MRGQRIYTKKSFALMNVVYKIIVVLFFPIWVPFYIISYLGVWCEDVLDFFDTVLTKILDKVIPQIK